MLAALFTLSAALLPGAEAAAGEAPRRNPLVYAAAALLALAAIYLFIRLLVWDRFNEETPNQEDPLLRTPEDT